MVTVRGANGVDYAVHVEGDDVRVYRGAAQLFAGRVTRDRKVGFVAGRTLPPDVMEQVCAIACPPPLEPDADEESEK
jgi:hypothetical protein